MAVDVQEFRLQVTGQQQSSQRLNRFGGSLQSLEQRADAARGRVSGAAGAVGNIGTIMASTNPMVGAYAGVIGTAGSAVEALTSALGGPLGLLAGGAVAALGIFVTNTQLATEEQEELNESVREGTKTLDDYISKVRQRQDIQARESRIAFGIDPTELQGRLEELQAELQSSNQDVRELREAAKDTTQSYDEIALANQMLESELQFRTELQTRIRQTEEKLERAQEEQRQMILEDVERKERQAREEEEERRRSKARSRRQEVRPLEGVPLSAVPGARATADDLRIQSRRTTAAEMAGAGRPGAPGGLPSMQAIESRQGLSQLGTDILGGDEQEKAAQSRLQTASEAAKAEQALAREVSATWQDASNTMATSMGSFFTALIQGNDEALGAILQNIGSQSIAQGTQAVLRAAVSAAFGNPAAGAQAAAGGALIAFGAALGGAGGGGGGASGAARPTAPQQSQTFQSGSLAPGETTVNIYGIADRRTGEQVVEAMRQTKRERGSQAVKV